MKKILSISLAFIFLLSTLGVSVVVGYCPMKKEYSFTFTGTNESCHCAKAMGGCCKYSKLILKKIQDDYTASEIQASASSIDFIAREFPSFIISNVCQRSANIISLKDLQPPEPPVPYSILFRSIQV